MADDAGGPVWARSKRGGPGLGGLFGALMFILALFGALVIVLAIMDKSVAKAGARVDGWIAPLTHMVGGAKTPAPAQSGLAINS